MTPEEWRKRGRDLAVPEGNVFMIEVGAETDRVPVLVLHGFPTASWDFEEAAAIIAQGRRVVLFDFLGFGFSSKPPDLGYSLFEQADVACAVARAAGIERAHLWTHDMGTSVATELLARRERGLLPFEIASVTLHNGSVHIGMAHLSVVQKLLKSPADDLVSRFMGKTTFSQQMKRICGKPLTDAALEGMWNLLSRDEGTRRLPRIIHYNDDRALYAGRWIGALRRLDLPLLVAWGALDPISLMSIGDRIARETQGARLVRWDDLGHYPHMEDPGRVGRTLMEFWADLG